MINDKEQSPAQAASNGFSLISDEKLLALYCTMLRCRMHQERVRILFGMNTQNGKAYGLAAGHEASIAGVGIDLLLEDTVSDLQGDFISIFIKGLPPGKLFANYAGSIAASANVHGHINLAIGSAVAYKANFENKIAVLFCDGECTAQSCWQEALKFAGENSLPVLFVSLSSGAEMSETADLKTNKRRIPPHEKAMNFPTIAVEGNDAVAVYRVACEAIAHARKGDGPTLIECQRRQTGDPLLNMEKYLIRKGLYSEKFKLEAKARILEELDAVIEMTDKIPSATLISGAMLAAEKGQELN